EGGKGRLRQMPEYRDNVLEETGLGNMHVQELGGLAQNDYQADSCFEADKYRVGDQVGYHAEAKQAPEQQESPHQERQGGGCRQQRGGGAAGCNRSESAGHQDSNGGTGRYA